MFRISSFSVRQRLAFCAIALLAVLVLQPAMAVRAAGTIQVTTTANDGAGSLREAIVAANATPGTPSEIVFNIAGSGPHTITITSALPVINAPVTIDGFCATCDGATPNSAAMDQPVNAIYKIVLSGSGLPAGTNGLTVTGSTVIISGLVINNFTQTGIALQGGSGHVVAGNFIGTDVSGSTAASNRGGVQSSAPNVTIGGTSAAARNVISGNSETGVSLLGSSTGFKIEGNFIGVAADGTTGLANKRYGVSTAGSGTIGGSTAAARNVITGNGLIGETWAGVAISSANNIVRGNYIGLDRTGTATPGVQHSGIKLFAGATDTLIRGNSISGNNGWGIDASFTSNVTGLKLFANRIGTNAAGTAAIGNGFGGILLYRAPGALIGSGLPGEGNLISGNAGGIHLAFDVQGMLIQGNKIGTDITGLLPVPNVGAGIRIYSTPTAEDVLIGGAAAEANVIAFNTGDGIWLESSQAARISILWNSIHSNGGLAIDLAPNGPNVNDPGDVDTGANGRQNYAEVLRARRTNAGTLATTYRIDTAPSQDLTIEFFVSTSCGVNKLSPQAETHYKRVGATHAAVAVDYTDPFPILDAGLFLTATMTDEAGNTSEVSPCLEVESRPRADVNCDDDVDATDALALLRAAAGLTTGLLPLHCAVDPIAFDTDVDADGSFTLHDLLQVRRAIAGLGN